MMEKAIIKLAYKKIIDASAKPGFEQNVFNDTYSEFRLQARVYNRGNKFNSVEEMILANPKANSLHYKVGFAIGLYVEELNKKMPDIFDNLGNPIPFDIFKTDICHSDINDKSKHKISLTFITAPLTFLDSFGKYLVLTNVVDDTELAQGVPSFTVGLQPNLSVVSYKLKEEIMRCDHKQ